MKKLSLIVLALTLIVASVSAATGTADLGPYESYFRYIGNYPHNEETPFSELLQGVSHDDNNWYITQQHYLWKIPVSIDLNNMPDENEWEFYGIKRVGIHPALVDAGYNHLGDLTYYRGYLVLPLECVKGPCNGKQPPPAIGVFRASDLQALGFEEIVTPDGSWTAVFPDTDDVTDPHGMVYTARTWHEVKYLSKYSIDWDNLSLDPASIGLEYKGDQRLKDIDDTNLTIHESQGASFSESGDHLFILTGGSDTPEEECAIHVFETKNLRRIAKSSQTDPFFNYECHPGDISDESEGVTVWDLDEVNAPGIWGQLHIMQIDVDITSDDDLYFHHYTGSVFADSAYTNPDADGTIWRPFPLVSQVSSYAWHGSKIQIQSGTYEEAVTFSGYEQINARGGNAVIGPSGNLSLSASGSINLAPSGLVRIP